MLALPLLVVAVQVTGAPELAARLALDPDVALAADGLRVDTRDGVARIGHTDGVRVAGELAGAAALQTDDGSALAPDVEWTTAPPVAARARLAFDPSRWRVVARARGEPLVLVGDAGVVIGARLDAAHNPALGRWGYLPFVLHAAVLRASGRTPGAFAEWPGAPVPHRALIVSWALSATVLGLALLAGFSLARRRARAEPNAYVRLLRPLTAPAVAAWSRPGIARPLGGFFLFLSATLLAMGPYLYITAMLVPSRVQPFPDVDGAWAPVEDLATLGYALVDFGLSLAFVQRFAEHRVSDPARAVRCLQLYVWWQLLTGFVLLVVAGGLACTFLPHTRYALFSRIVLVRTAMQVPGLLSLFTLFFQAAQRFDYQLGLDLLEKRLLFVALPIPLVLLCRALGRAHPAIGEPFGAILGIAAGQYAALLVTFAIGLRLYRRLGLPVGPLFHAGFDGATFRDMIKFGVGVVAGRAPYYLANAAEIAIVTALLPGYPAWLGIRQLIFGRLVFTLWFMLPFIDSGVPAFSEALAAKKLQLARYYVVRYLQFSNLFVALVIGFLLGAGRALILHGLSPEWRPAATYLPLALAVGAFLPAAWVSDALQKGAGRSGLDAGLLTVEQTLRVALFLVLIPRLGFAGIFVAILIAIALKVSAAWWVNHRYLLRLVAQPWSTFGAPALTGATWYVTLSTVALLLPKDAPSAIGLFVVAALCTFPLGFFVCGLVGGLDDAAVAELREAAELASIMRPVARRLTSIAAAGARRSPFRRPAPPLAADAAREADQIASLERL